MKPGLVPGIVLIILSIGEIKMDRFSWVKDISNIEQHLQDLKYPNNGSLKIFVEIIMDSSGGLDTLCKLYDAFYKSDLLFNGNFIDQLAKIYLRQNPDKDAHALARILGVHIRTIYEWRNSFNKKSIGRKSLFN